MDYTGYCYEKRFTFFDSFDVEGLKNFMITDDKKTIQKILSDIKKMTQIDDKITHVNIKFSMRACETLTSKEIENLSDTTRDFFYFIRANSKIQSNKKLTKKTAETSLNKLLYLDIDNNEKII